MTLPRGWAQASIGSLCTLVNGRAFKPSEWSTSGLKIIRIQNLNREDADFNHFAGPVDDNHLVESGDLLFAWSGTPGTSFGAHIWRGQRAVLNQHIFKIRYREELFHREFFRLAINTKLDELIGKAHGGAGLAHVTKGRFEETRVEIPPPVEQRRIVAKLNALNARISSTKKQIQRSRTLSAKMRERVVTSAFNGQLTLNWRRNQRDGRQHEALAKVSHRVSSSTKRKIADISWRPDLQLPHGWRWASVDSVTTLCDYGTSAKSTHDDKGIPVLRMGNIQQGKLDWSSLKHLPPNETGKSPLLLQAGDVLFNRTNSFDLVGKSAVFPGYHREVSFASYLIRLRAQGITAELLSFYLNSSFGRAWVEVVASQQVGQANVNGSKLKSLGIPLPPADEQAEIVCLIQAAFARADRLEAEAARAVALLDRLEQSILAKAFRGELVPQDPADEPAIALLDRVRAERAVVPKARRGRGAVGRAEAQ